MRIIINANWHPKAGVLLKVAIDPRTLPGCSDVRSKNVGRDIARSLLLPLCKEFAGGGKPGVSLDLDRAARETLGLTEGKEEPPCAD